MTTDESRSTSQELTTALVRRELAWDELIGLMRSPKSETRFDETINALQGEVDWNERIL